MNKETMMTPEEVTALKEEVTKTVEDQMAIEAEMTRTEAIDALINALEALKAEPGMGGLGEEADNGMKLPEQEEEEPQV